MLEAFVPESGGQVLINAGNSEVGLCLQAIALKKGIPLVACVRRKEAKELILQALPKLEDKRVIVEGKGSDLTFEKLAEEKPFTLALNAVGGESALRQLNHLAFGGKQITYGAMSGKPSRVLANHLIFKNLRLEGFWLHSWTEKVSPDVVRQKLSELETMSLPLLQPNFFTF